VRERMYSAPLRLKRFLSDALRPILPKRTSVRVILFGPLRGARIHTSWHDYPGAILGTTERKLLLWFQKNVKTGETWLDVGAHYGYTAIALSRLVGPTGRVFAFEPVQATAASLERTRAANALEQLTVVPIALNDQPRPRMLHVPSIRGMAVSTSSSGEALETIFSISLDIYWPELAASGTRIDGIKIDVQGMELHVLKGMRRLLEIWTPKLVIEFHPGVNRGLVLDLLASAGYSTACQAINDNLKGELADDRSYFFTPDSSQCAFSSTRSITGRS
jgi:FkbM family methyltransferase